MPGVKYPPDMETFCRVKGLTRTLPEIAEAIRQRYGYQMTETALKCYLNRRQITYQRRPRPQKWPDSIAFFLQHHPDRAELSHEEARRQVKEQLGIAMTVNEFEGYLKRHRIILRGKDSGCFKPGYTPVNKGKKLSEETRRKVAATWFPRGAVPRNRKPVGSRTTTKDGYAKIKTGGPNRWQFLHVLNWTREHGPVPRGKVIIFLDGDKQNCDVSNLLCVSRAALVRANQKGVIKPHAEVTKSGLLLCELGAEVRKIRREHDSGRQGGDVYQAADQQGRGDGAQVLLGGADSCPGSAGHGGGAAFLDRGQSPRTETAPGTAPGA